MLVNKLILSNFIPSLNRELFKHSIKYIVYFIFLTFSTFCSAETLRILHFNDIYQTKSNDGKAGFAEMSTLLNTQRKNSKYVITTFSGDMAPAFYDNYPLEPTQVIDLLNCFEIDYAVFGNHEFDAGLPTLQQVIKKSNFKWLGGNVLWKKNNKPLTIKTAIKKVGKFKVGFISIVLPETPQSSSPGNDLVFTPIIKSATEQVSKLKKQKVDCIIALTHLTVDQDKTLARALPEINLILGGHDHDPRTFFVGQTMIHKSGVDATYLGVIDLHLNQDKKANKTNVMFEWKMIANAGQKPDPKVVKAINNFGIDFNGFLQHKIGTTESALDGREITVRNRENSVGNMIANAMLEYSNADVAFINGGFIRGNRLIPAGEQLTRSHILQMIPFPNRVIVLKLKGWQLKEVMEHSLSGREFDATFPQISGMRIVYKLSKPKGARIQCLEINGTPYNPEKIYNVATSDFLFSGGDGFGAYFIKYEAPVSYDRSELINKVVMEYISNKKVVKPIEDGRIKEERQN